MPCQLSGDVGRGERHARPFIFAASPATSTSDTRADRRDGRQDAVLDAHRIEVQFLAARAKFIFSSDGIWNYPPGPTYVR